jgi:Sulfatase
MTVDQGRSGEPVATAPPVDDDGPGDAPGGGRPSRRARLAGRAWREQGLLALELFALAAFAFGRPVLDSFGRSPMTLLVRGVTGWWVVVFGLIVVLVPGLVIAASSLALGAVAQPARAWVHPVMVGAVGAVGVWRLGQDATDLPGEATRLVLAAGVAAVVLTALRRWVPVTGTFLRFAGMSCVIYVVQFLALSPVADLVTVEQPALDEDLVAGVRAQLGDDPPDVVFLVFDGLPLVSLLDGTGHLDAELYPHFAELAGDGTWYRNSTTVAAFTQQAVPALLTGRYPSTSQWRIFQDSDPDNLFRLLGGNYDVQAREQLTTLCGAPICAQPPTDLTGLLGDAVDHWTRGPGPQSGGSGLTVDALPSGYVDAAQWQGRLDLEPGAQPHLVFHHVMLPHEPWEVTGDGTRYATTTWATGHRMDGWSESGTAVGRQRHLLQVQAADRILGRYFDALRAAGTYDDTVVVVTADHGMSFLPGTSSRGLTADNYDQIMWTPLIIKGPGQAAGRIDDTDVRSIDIVPTIARMLGVELPWPVDGVPVGEAAGRGGTKPLIDHELNELHPPDGEKVIELDARAGFARVLAADPVEGSGPDAVWRRTAHGRLVGQRVADLDVGDAADGAVTVEQRSALDDVDTGEPLPLEVVGSTQLAEGTHVAYALNGTIGAVTKVEPGLGDGDTLAHGLIPPRLFVDGRNELAAYVVDGPAGGEVLRPLPVAGG